jgi:hypothetical protein
MQRALLARYANLLLGIWLVTSAFLWRHSPAQFTNSWSVGSLCLVVASLARVVQPIRYGNTALGLWLIVSTPWLEGLDRSTAINNLAVGAAILVLSLLPRRSAILSSH